MIDGLPKMQFPKNTYGIVGAFGLIDVKLKTSLGNYPPLRTNVFQLMRELGNAVAFVYIADIARQINNNRYGPLLNSLNPTELGQSNGINAPLIKAVKEMTQIATIVQSPVGNFSDLIANGIQQSFIHHERNNSNSVLAQVLYRLYSLIDEKFSGDWKGPPVSSDSMNVLDHENPRNLCRLLSCLSFIYCTPNVSNSQHETPPDVQVFGDGFILTVSLLLHLTGFYKCYVLTDLSQIVVKIDQTQPIDRVKHAELNKSNIHYSGSKNTKGRSPSNTVEEQEAMILKFLVNVKLYKEKLEYFASQLHSFFPSPCVEIKINVVPPRTEDEMRIVSGHSINQTSQLGRNSLFGGLSPTIAQSSNQQTIHHSRTKSNSTSFTLQAPQSPSSPI